MKLHIPKMNKMSQQKFATEHGIWTNEKWDCVHFSDELKFNCSVVTEEVSFVAVLRNDIRVSALKAALNLEEKL